MRSREQGVALIIGLVILVVLALIGTAAYSVATQDERLAGNARDRARALDAAETSLRDCEFYVMKQTSDTAFAGAGGMYMAQNTAGSTWIGKLLGQSGGPTYRSLGTNTSGKPINPEWSSTPICVAEKFPQSAARSLQPIGPAGLPLGSNGTTVNVAHVTALGYGANNNTKVMVESYVAW
jgi:type IV pilus assembly protein PilX